MRSGGGADLDEYEDVGTVVPAMDEMTEAVPEGSQVDGEDER